MSDAKNLNDFFAQQSKKKKNKKGGATQAKPSAAATASTEEIKETQAAAATTQPVPTPAQDFADSSDDESNQIVINEAQKKIVDRKELEASKKDEEEGNAGWGLGTMLGAGADASSGSLPSAAAAKGPQTGGLKMAFGKPTFTRKQKGIMDQQDFPDLEAANTGSGEQTRSKADGAMMFGGGAMARGPREDKPAGEEIKMAATKPVFRGKAKLNLGGANNDDVNNSRMNYDFSKMNMSAASTKKPEGAAGEGGRREAPAFDDDEDFETVKEKEKRAPRPKRDFEEPQFGGGKPMFTRGGGNRMN